MLPTTTPFPQITDLDGNPLNDGRIYFGMPNENPETDPIAVYWDAAGTQPVAQPVKTLNGYPVRTGAPARIFCDSEYSITVKNKAGSLVYYAPTSTNFDQASQFASSTGSSLLGYANGGTKMTAEKALDILYFGTANVMNPKYAGGAKGDYNGTTGANDTAAFAAALADAKTNKKALVIPHTDKAYQLDADTLNFAGQGLQIHTTGKPTLWFTGTGKGFMLDAGSGGLFVSDMLVGPLLVKGGPGITDGFYCRGVVRSRFSAIEVQECNHYAFWILFSVSNTFDNLKYSAGSQTTKALRGLVLSNSGTSYYTTDTTFINPIIEDFASGLGIYLEDASGNFFVGGTVEGVATGMTVSAVSKRNSFKNLWFEANSARDLAEGGIFNTYYDCNFSSGSSSPNVDLDTGQGIQFYAGYIRTANLQSTSKDTLFVGCGFDQNLGGSLGITGTGTYRCLDLKKIDNSGNVVGKMPDMLGNGGKTMQNVTASRVLGTTYTNTSGNPIDVSVTVTLTSNAVAQAFVDGIDVATLSNDGSLTKDNTIYFKVPAGSTYSVNQIVATATKVKWMEFR